ncbi:MAG: DUF971 domain-containing protein [Gammaproteobacteria bacterium]|nr:DUF971 domain-containing protein [Gammaproteobacteria bacterium]MYD79730.1 DUF971 domain-containing protein [Gammaproteobacteria bacterium]
MQPASIRYHQKTRTLELQYSDGQNAVLSAELLRVFSPSAEVRGHSEDQRVLQTGKKQVKIQSVDPIGNYAIRIEFDDGHDTGIYSWGYLRELIDRQEEYWAQYLRDLEQANASRLPQIPLGHWNPKE